MIELSMHEIHQYYGANHVIKGMTFEVYKGEKIGLLGKNGSGKTTLFKIITGEESTESGSLSKATGKKIEILAQIPIFAEGNTVDDILRSSFAEVVEIHKSMKEIEGDADPAILKRYGKLMEDYERLGGYEIETKIDKICHGMNIGESMRGSSFDLLSGGEKTRVNLARILLRDADILLLDEPTNHLDLESLAWFEQFLRDFPGTVVVISHDRVFLDHIVTRIIEIEDGQANFYSGNYSFYVEEKEQRFLTQAEQYKQQQRKIQQLETAIKRQRVWADMNPSNTGLARRALAMEKRIEQMDKVERPTKSRKLTEEFDSGGYAAKEIVSLDAVCKAYGSNVLMKDVSISISRNERIALIGANGCGKSTLIRMIMGEENCDSGELKISSNVKIAYMPQIIVFEDDNATVLETLRNVTRLPEENLRSILARFQFKASDVLKKVSTLSGGEKSRLKLCLLMQSQANFLILDEPTNHLDIESREWIEDAVADWSGTILFISHDRYFLNQFASKVWRMKDGSITAFDGGFEAYLLAAEAKQKLQNTPTRKKKKNHPPAKTKEPPKAITSPETRIEQAEAELRKVDEEIHTKLSSIDYEELDALYQKKSELEEQIADLYDQWMRESEGNHD